MDDWKIKEEEAKKAEKEEEETTSSIQMSSRLELLYTELAVLHMDDEPHKFVMQDHYRGKGVHLDHRWERLRDGEVLDGMTVAHMKPGIIKEPVRDLKTAYSYTKRDELFKISNKPGPLRMFADEKKPEPRDWLFVEGVVEPGEVGATPYEFGVFAIRDKGVQYYGAQKPFFKEFFLKGKKYTGRWIYRLIQRRKPVGAKAVFLWQFGKPIDQAPYVLSRRAQNENWIPPHNVSCLPPEIREKIPKEYRYWIHRDRKRRIEVRNALRKALKGLNITYEGVKLEQAVPYGYQWHFWRKRPLIRVGPTAQHWDLRIQLAPKKPLAHFVLYDDILEKGVSAGYYKEDPDPAWLHKEGYLPPGTVGNPTKATPAWIKLITKGKVVILEKSKTFWKLKFLSGRLKGLWVIRWEEPTTNLVTVERSELPKPKR